MDGLFFCGNKYTSRKDGGLLDKTTLPKKTSAKDLFIIR